MTGNCFCNRFFSVISKRSAPNISRVQGWRVMGGRIFARFAFPIASFKPLIKNLKSSSVRIETLFVRVAVAWQAAQIGVSTTYCFGPLLHCRRAKSVPQSQTSVSPSPAVETLLYHVGIDFPAEMGF